MTNMKLAHDTFNPTVHFILVKQPTLKNADMIKMFDVKPKLKIKSTIISVKNRHKR